MKTIRIREIEIGAGMPKICVPVTGVTESEILEQTAQEVQIVVKDTGIGIPREDQDRVFERFYRVDKSHSKEIGGTGLGLSIVKHAVSTLDGSVGLGSEVGSGTEICMKFPKVHRE